MSTEKIYEVFANEEFVKSLLELETASKVQTALKEQGVEFSDKEALALYDLLTKIKNGEITKEQVEKLQQQSESGELDEEALEQVAGGFWPFILPIAGIVLSVAAVVLAVVNYSTDD